MSETPARPKGQVASPPGGPSVEFIVSREAAGSRLDRFVATAMGVSRSELQRWIEGGRVAIDGEARDAGTRLRAGSRVVVRPEAPASTRAVPDANVRFEVLHVDDAIVVVDKPAGLVVHPARGHEDGTLVNGLLALNLFRREDLVGLAGEGEHARPGIVHRLDKGTSGVMVVARTPQAREALKAQFQAHTIERAYDAIAVGAAEERTIATLHGRNPHDRLRFTTRVAQGKPATTHVRVLARLHGATHLACRLETGRTHQIRVHLAESGTPVLGDPLYGKVARDARVAGGRRGAGAPGPACAGAGHRSSSYGSPPPL